MSSFVIPLIPYGWADYSRPEYPGTLKFEEVWPGLRTGATPWRFTPDKDFAEATAEELDESGLFEKVVFSERGSDGDLIFRGELKSTNYKAEAYYYGLSMALLPPGLVGAPIGHVSNELVIELMVEEQATGTVLWHKNYREAAEATFFAYWAPPEFYYDRLFALIMRDVVKSLQAELPAMFSGSIYGGPGLSRSSSPN